MERSIHDQDERRLDGASPTGGSGWRAQLRFAWLGTDDRGLHDEIIAAQYARVMASVPLLYIAVAAMALIAAYGSGGDLDWRHHIVPPAFFFIVGVARGLIWLRRRYEPVDVDRMQKRLRETAVIGLIIATVGGVWTISAFYDTIETRRLLTPIFVMLISMSATICLSSIPRTAISMMFMSLAPSCLAMILSDDIGLRAVGLGMIVVALLLAGMICHHFATMVASIQMGRKLSELAETDMLTRLGNRRALQFCFEAAQEGQSPPEEHALLMIDLDAFKAANDRYGHAAGDAVLRATADRLRRLCEDAICVARLGGDEFAILFADMPTKALSARIAALRSAIVEPIEFENSRIVIGAGIGLSKGTELGQLLREADRALYDEKGGINRRTKKVDVV